MSIFKLTYLKSCKQNNAGINIILYVFFILKWLIRKFCACISKSLVSTKFCSSPFCLIASYCTYNLLNILGHPLKEIRERSLLLLIAKLKLGWELDDELSRTRELLEALLAWFHTPQQSLQSEALELLLTTIKVIC